MGRKKAPSKNGSIHKPQKQIQQHSDLLELGRLVGVALEREHHRTGLRVAASRAHAPQRASTVSLRHEVVRAGCPEAAIAVFVVAVLLAGPQQLAH